LSYARPLQSNNSVLRRKLKLVAGPGNHRTKAP
jgi:hypothetical protein